MTGQPWHVSVLVPARNEEALLPRCLRSLMRARARLPLPITCNLIVAVDHSTDRTGEVAERMLRSYGVVVYTNAGAVGVARGLAADTALALHTGPSDRHWLANTDADCSLPENWLLQQVAFAATGCEAIAGTVDVDGFEEHGLNVPSRFRETYLIGGDGSHSHIHGANLGVRADAYIRAGGWRGLETREDHDLWSCLIQTGASTLSTNCVKVVTSGRRNGRAPHGFAEALAAHNVTAA